MELLSELINNHRPSMNDGKFTLFAPGEQVQEMEYSYKTLLPPIADVEPVHLPTPAHRQKSTKW